MQKDFWGKDGFVWWYGVVEDRFDPQLAGRCKVRIMGWHHEDKQLMPTEELQWASPSLPLDSGRMNTTGIMEGARVWGFFFDGVKAQEPVIIGLIPGVNEKPANPEIGYEDPRPDSLLTGHKVPREPDKLIQHDDGSGNDIEEQEKKSRFPEEHFLHEPDTSRYARGYDGGFIEKTIVPLKIENIDIGQRDIPTGAHPAGTGTDVSSPGTEWTERETAYDTKYPYNKVYFSEGGHIIEVDDTPFKERLHWYHRVGTFKEIDPVGGVVEKIVDNEFRIVLETRHVHIEASDLETVDWFKKLYVNKDKKAGFNYDITIGEGGDLNITTEGGKMNIYLKGDYNLYVDGSAYVEVEDDLIATVHRDVHATVDRDCYVTIKGNLNGHVLGDATVQIDGDLRCKVGGNWIGQVDGDKVQHIGGNYKLVVDGDIEIIAGGDITSQAEGDITEVAGGDIISSAGSNITEVAEGNILEAAVGNIDSLAELEIRRLAIGNISDTAPVIFHNAGVTNCTALLTGITTDSDGDITPAGPAGPIPDDAPSVPSPLEVEDVKIDVQDAIITELQEQIAPTLIEERLQDIYVDIELATEFVTSQIEANSSSPASGSAAGGAGGAGGPKGPSVPVDGPGGFLWKPVGENSGVLTVLFHGGGDASVYTAIKDGDGYRKGDKIESLSYIKTFGPDGRGIYRGSKPGAQYGSAPVIVSAGGNDYVISDPSLRHD